MKNRVGIIVKKAVENIFKKPATNISSDGRMDIGEHYRGKLTYDPSNCTGCGLCMRACPAGAIKIVNEGTKEERKMKAVLNVGQCIFCCQCVDSCNRMCLSYTQNIDLSSFSKKDLFVQL